MKKETFENKWDDTNESESLVETYKFFFGEYEIEDEQ